jgi:hypothetical protein
MKVRLLRLAGAGVLGVLAAGLVWASCRSGAVGVRGAQRLQKHDGAKRHAANPLGSAVLRPSQKNSISRSIWRFLTLEE